MSDFNVKTWRDRVSEYPMRRNLEYEDGTIEVATVSRNEGDVSTEGDAFSAANMNDLEDRVEEAVNSKFDSANVVATYETAISAESPGTVPDCIVLAEMAANFQAGCDTISGALESVGIATAESAGPDEIAEALTEAYKGEASANLDCDEYVELEAGIYSGGIIAANSLSSQTPGDATAEDIAEGAIAWVNGEKIVGTATIATDDTGDGDDDGDDTGSGGNTIYEDEEDTVIAGVGVHFRDHDGTILYSYTWAEIASLSSLPALPSWTTDEDIEMTCTGWNWTLSELQDFGAGGRVDVSADYEPTDGKTHLIMLIPAGDSVSLYLRTSVADNAVLIDWGDGSTEYTTATSATVYTHGYENTAAAQYDITIEAVNGTCMLGAESGSYNFFYLSTSTIDRRLLKAYIGACVTEAGYRCFYRCVTLSELTLSESCAILGSGMAQYCYVMKYVSIPYGITNFPSYAFAYCYALTHACLPGSLTDVGSFPFNSASIEAIAISSSVIDVGAGLAYANHTLHYISIGEGVESIRTSMCTSCYILEKVRYPKTITSAGEATSGSSVFNFAGCYCLETIENYYDTGEYTDSTYAGASFSYCYSLKNFVDPVLITSYLDLSVCPITYDSAVAIIGALSEDSTATVTFSSYTYCQLTDDDIAIATDKGWTIAEG